MRLIDKETGKRLKKEDPLQKQPEKGEEGEEMSPMDPPDAFHPPDNLEPVPYEKMPKVLQLLMDEHRDVLEAISDFKELLERYKEQGWKMSQADDQAFYRFLDIVDQAVLDHNEREEKTVFPTLAERLKEAGEHNQHLFEESQEKTGVDILEEDHAHFVQLSALLREFIGIVNGSRMNFFASVRIR